MVVKKCITKMIGKVVCIVLGVLLATTMEVVVFAEESVEVNGVSIHIGDKEPATV